MDATGHTTATRYTAATVRAPWSGEWRMAATGRISDMAEWSSTGGESQLDTAYWSSSSASLPTLWTLEAAWFHST